MAALDALDRGRASRSFFVVLALFAPLIAPYGFDQVRSRRRPRSRSRRRPSRDHLFGTTVQSTDVLSRVIWGARRRSRSSCSRVLFSLVVGVPLGLSPATSAAGSTGARADHGRAVRVPVPAAGDRDRVPARRQARSGDRHGGDRDHGRLHPAVLPRGPQPRDQRPGGALRRGGARARRAARARSSAATSSTT